MTLLRNFVRDDRGQDLIEYALLCGFVTLGVVLAVTNLGAAVNGIFGGIDTQVAAIPAP
jgi:Flp pilus assembly pilin Flp